MPRLSSHPLPVAALHRPALRYIYATTPPTPRTAPVAEVGAGRKEFRLEDPVQPSHLPPVAEREVLDERYLLEGEIDSGGTAKILLARDLTTGKKRAVKRLMDRSANDAILRSCFLAGARAAMDVEHQNVVRVLSVHEPASGHPYAVMELLEGEPLNATLAREQKLSSDRVIALARGAARGLAAAHAFGIIHCDVKPENLFVVPGPEESALKILDFDLAKVPRAEPPPGPEDRLILRGTAKYMAPEQIVCDPVDPRTDVYALGLVLFRLLTGHVPFDLELGVALLRHHLSSPVPPPSWLVDDLDPRLDAVVVRATRKAPENRYQDMASLLADLDAIALGLELVSLPAPGVTDRYVPRSDRAREAARVLESAA
jgi:serine/threonine protein kinase